MRVSPAGLLAHSEGEALAMADHVTMITHNHPDGLTGARAVSLAVFWARSGLDSGAIQERLGQRFGYDLTASTDELRCFYRRTEKAADSVPQALICALEASSYEDAVRNAVSIGGDADTLAAIAGGVAEARFGMPAEIAGEAWGFLPNDMRRVIRLLYDQCQEDGENQM